MSGVTPALLLTLVQIPASAESGRSARHTRSKPVPLLRGMPTANTEALQTLKKCGMTVDLVARAQSGDDEAFARLIEPYRRELQVHCYQDRKSTRLNSSHLGISYAVFCLKKK